MRPSRHNPGDPTAVTSNVGFTRRSCPDERLWPGCCGVRAPGAGGMRNDDDMLGSFSPPAATGTPRATAAPTASPSPTLDVPAGWVLYHSSVNHVSFFHPTTCN